MRAALQILFVIAMAAVAAAVVSGCTTSRAPRGPALRCWGGEVLTPLPGLGQDPAPLRVHHVLTSKSANSTSGTSTFERDVTFERETSGTALTLRAVGRVDLGHYLAVGDRGVAVARDRERGWQLEATGTQADLVAFDGITDRSRTMLEDRFHTIAIGSGGTTLARSLRGEWRREESGTSRDLHAIASTGSSLVAVGDAGTMIERLPSGKWRTIASGTDASLIAVRACGAGRLCARSDEGVGVGVGVGVVCIQEDGRLVCTQRPTPPEAEPLPSSSFRLRSQKTKRDWLAQIAIAPSGDIVLSTNPSAFEPTSAIVQAPFARAVTAVDLDAAEGFLVGEDGLIVHVDARPLMVRPQTCDR